MPMPSEFPCRAPEGDGLCDLSSRGQLSQAAFPFDPLAVAARLASSLATPTPGAAHANAVAFLRRRKGFAVEEKDLLLMLAQPIDQACGRSFLPPSRLSSRPTGKPAQSGSVRSIGWRARCNGAFSIRRNCPTRARRRAPRSSTRLRPARSLFGLAPIPSPPRHLELHPGLPGLDGSGAVLDPGAALFAAA